MKRFALILSLVLLLPALASAGDWERILKDDGITVWRRDAKGSLVQFRGRGVVDAPLAKVMAVVVTVDRLCEWRANCVKSYQIERLAEHRLVVYYRVESPAPLVSDRDVVLKSQCELGVDKGVKCSFAATEHPKDPTPDDAVRMPTLKGYWKLVPKGPNRTEATYQVVADPGGWIPMWVANLASKKLPFRAIAGLRDQVGKDYSAMEAKIQARLDAASVGGAQ